MSNNRKDKIINSVVFGAAVVFTFSIPFIIYATVYWIGDAPIYEKKDVLAYYGSIVGACFGGFITAAGLYYTLQQNAETFEKQRNIDKDNREKDEINSVMPVLKIGQNIESRSDLYLNANYINTHAPNTTSPDNFKIYIKNIGIGPAIDIKIKLGNYEVVNSTNLVNLIDLGVEEKITIDIRTKYNTLENDINGNKYIKVLLECKDVYNKKIYKYHINAIKPTTYSNYEVFENAMKENFLVP